jgi:hypothetical protein
MEEEIIYIDSIIAKVNSQLVVATQQHEKYALQREKNLCNSIKSHLINAQIPKKNDSTSRSY